MASPNDAQFDREASSFRPDRRPFLYGLLANGILAFLFLALPNMRARWRATEAREAFGEFAACFLGGTASDDPGLALPAGEREHFARLVMHGPATWPASCDAALTAVAPTPATFLFPSVKQADADTRAAIDLMRAESQILRGASRKKLGHVPSRPLLAFARLRGSLAMLLEATGSASVIDRDAITLPELTETIVATRVPLSAGAGGVLHTQSDRGAFEAYSLDQRGLSWVRIHDGAVDRHRPKRSRLLRALTFTFDPLLVWSLTKARCAELDHGCVHRAMGVALLGAVGQALPHPQWLTAHPSGRPDRDVIVNGDRLWVTALDAGPAGRELREFAVKPATAPDSDPVGALRLWSLGEREIVDSLLIATNAAPELLSASVDGVNSVIERRTFEPTESVEVITTVPGITPSLLACNVAPPVPPSLGGTIASGSTWVATITETNTSITVIRTDNTRATIGLEHITGTVPPKLGGTGAPTRASPLHPDDPARDRAVLLCDADRAVVMSLDDNTHTLHAQTCDNELQCAPSRTVASGVTTFAAVLRGNDLIFATAGDAAHAQVQVHRLDALLSPLGTPQTPVACWLPAEGLCGQPTLTQDADRVVLAAREQSDLLAIESRDSGVTWQPMSGLHTSAAGVPAAPTDRSIMEIHRDRKRYSQ